MSYRIRLNDITIGWTELENGDQAGGLAYGRFRPGDGYELVQPIMQLHAEAVPERAGPTLDGEKLARFLAAADALPLQLVDDEGARIPTSLIRIFDYRSVRSSEPLEVEVRPADERFWRRWKPFS